ncbi:relaxase/mobilization nuclease domain-containing protein [Maribellus comscasis]|uniref:Relaxase/mobilization nuclease domain-containing protein n=1 Tax=Maribellus comscasis TaxID=2681766 RepID=A0A6I6K224_9BACT|nr:relaxase/mobilization nuclease domain-containing protein [Maribellus comscasis]QGY47709.1 relaxase/mobilization nuclease domain-containing protein [Maribellus comscasis]
MVIVIHQSLSTQNALFYNEKKVEQHKAVFFKSGNTPTINPFAGTKYDRLNILHEIEERNSRVKKKGLHISVNPTVLDLVRMGEPGIRSEIDNLMEHLGYGNQPYFVYNHADLDRVHFHIVSTRIDQQTGKKIRDNYEKEKVKRFIQSLQQKYDLTKEIIDDKTDLKFSSKSGYLKLSLEELFYQLNQIESITNKQLYDKSLKLFNVEVRKVKRGHIVCIVDESGKIIRHPMKLSAFDIRPKFHLGAKTVLEINLAKPPVDKFQLAQLARDLNRLVESSRELDLNRKQKIKKSNPSYKQKRYRNRF